MAKQLINQTSFTSGEISPRLYSRSDTAEYAKGLETATNCTVTSHGTVKRRNGSQYIAEVKDSSAAVRLVRFQFSQTLAFILEFGNTYIRFFKDSGQVTESDLTITGITAANPGVVTSTSHGLSDGDHVYITGVVGMTEVNSSTVPYKVANKTANTFELNDVDDNAIDTSAYTAYSSGGVINKIYEVVSPYSTAEVQDIQYSQAGSTLYIAHPSYAPRTLTRTSDTNWTLASLNLLPPPTYESGYLDTGMTVTPAATTGVGVNFTAGSAVFLDGDVGRQIINSSSGETGRASIVSITSTTVAVCDIVEDFTDTNAIADGDWSIDLSPVVDLETDASQAGAIANVRSEYQSGTLGDRFTITGITGANPGVVTTSASHGYVNGDRVQINDVVGMTQVNGNVYTVKGKTATTFQLADDNNTNVDTTNYTTYASGGIVRKRLTGLAVDAFRSADVGKYILMNGGVLQVVTVNAADDIDCEIIKSLNNTDTTGNWTLEVDTWDSTRGFPRAVGQYEQRLIFGGTTAQPQNIWMSEIGIFEGFGAGPDDEDALDIELVSNEVNEINWISPSRDLVVGTSGGELTVSGGTAAAITPSNVIQQSRTSYGSDTQQVSNVGDEILFIQNSARKVRTFRYDFNIDGYTGEDLTYLAEHITEGGLGEIIYAQEPDTTIYAITTNGDMITGTYDRSKKIIAWTTFATDGSYENVQTIGKSEEDQIWTVAKRTVNSATKRFIELFVPGDGLDDLHAFQDSFLTLSLNKTITNITAASPAVVTSASHGFSDGDKVIIKDLVDPADADLDADATNMSSLNNCSFTVANKTANTFELGTLDTSAYNAYGSGGNAWEKVTSVGGLDHLEGKAVAIRADGAKLPNETVSSGTITLDESAGEIVIGLPFTTTIKTLGHEFDSGTGSMQGQRVRWSRPLLRVLNSTRPLMNGEFLPNRNAADKMDKKVPLFSGFLEYGPLNWSNTSALTITLTDPLPLEVSGMTGSIDSGVK